MDSSENRDLDATIETALSTEPLRPVSPGFFGRVRQRLALVAMIRQEQRRFRQYAVGFGAAVLAAFGGLLLAYIASIPSRLAWYVPGGMGFVDYVNTQLLLSMWMLVAVIALGLAVPFGAMIFTFRRPTARRGGSDEKHRHTIFW